MAAIAVELTLAIVAAFRAGGLAERNIRVASESCFEPSGPAWAFCSLYDLY